MQLSMNPLIKMTHNKYQTYPQTVNINNNKTEQNLLYAGSLHADPPHKLNPPTAPILM